MDCKFKNDLGYISITEDVLSIMAGYAALECYGIVSMASKRASDGLVEFLGRENLARGVRVGVIDDVVHVDLFIIVEYGISISAVAKNIIETVQYRLEHQAGMKVGKVNVAVEGIRVAAENVR